MNIVNGQVRKAVDSEDCLVFLFKGTMNRRTMGHGSFADLEDGAHTSGVNKSPRLCDEISTRVLHKS